MALIKGKTLVEQTTDRIQKKNKQMKVFVGIS